LNNELCDLRNQLSALFLSWIGSKKLETKYGVKLTLHSKVINVGSYFEKQARIAGQNYIPCEICGENRITHFCHILPKEFGGPDVPENYICLCPTHHHLFDHSRLLKSEWEKIDFSKKMIPAQEYVKNVRKRQLQTFWIE
ncbi:HNH endonuclease, partial [bacterium]|nr:HNH endonuclease [bacterium]